MSWKAFVQLSPVGQFIDDTSQQSSGKDNGLSGLMGDVFLDRMGIADAVENDYVSRKTLYLFTDSVELRGCAVGRAIEYGGL